MSQLKISLKNVAQTLTAAHGTTTLTGFSLLRLLTLASILPCWLHAVANGSESWPSSPFSASANLGIYSEHINYRLPLNEGSSQSSKLDKDAFVGGVGILVGPVMQASLELSGSYRYQHEWYTEAQALAEPEAPAAPFSAPSFSGNHLERLHTWQLEARYHIDKRLSLGLWQDITIKNAGSKYDLSPSSPQLTKASYRVSDQIATLPWLRYQWQDDRHSSWLVVYLYKEYQHLFADLSLQTYHLGGDESFVSLLAAHAWQPASLPALQLVVTAAALRTRANDLWQEIRRRSAVIAGRYQLTDKVIISGFLRGHHDAYLAPYLLTKRPEAGAPLPRQRLDQAYSMHLAMSYDITPRWRLAFHAETLKNSSPKFKDKEFTRNNVMINVSMALPERSTALLPPWLKEGDYLQQRFEINAIK